MTTRTRDSLMTSFYSARSTEERAAVARQLRALDAARTDSEDCDCSDPNCLACEARLDASDVVGTDLRKAGRWLGQDRVRSLRESDRTERRVLVGTLLAAARAAGEDDPELLARIRGASLDTLRAAYEQCPEPDEERTDTMSHDPEATARAKMNRDAHTAHLRPLSGTAGEAPRVPTAEEQVRLDAAERAHDDNRKWLDGFRADRADAPEDDEERTDAARETFEDGTPVDDAERKASRRMHAEAARRSREPLSFQDKKQLEIARLARETDDEVA